MSEKRSPSDRWLTCGILDIDDEKKKRNFHFSFHFILPLTEIQQQ